MVPPRTHVSRCGQVSHECDQGKQHPHPTVGERLGPGRFCPAGVGSGKAGAGSSRHHPKDTCRVPGLAGSPAHSQGSRELGSPLPKGAGDVWEARTRMAPIPQERPGARG